MREIVRPTSAADINSRPMAASPAAPMRDLDLLLRLSGRIVKGCRLPGSLAFAGRVGRNDGRESSPASPGLPQVTSSALPLTTQPTEDRMSDQPNESARPLISFV